MRCSKASSSVFCAPAKLALLSGTFIVFACGSAQVESAIKLPVENTQVAKRISVGAEFSERYLPLLKDKRVGVITNQTGMIGHVHLVDSLLAMGINVQKVFCPEHGFRGTADAGAKIDDAKDPNTGLPLISLYGKNRKPSKEQLAGIDVLVFDIQDVGVRFYTYISTMHYCMEAAAEQNIAFLVFDRPNPNGFYVDGPILEQEHSSFVGIHPIPIVHGLTVGELAQMINKEGWLANQVSCALTVIPCRNYTHDSLYVLPVQPSPNLPNMASIYLYPSLGLFEGTDLSVGRGTAFPFQCVGHPELGIGNFSFTPVSGPGSKYPPQEDKKCNGFDLREFGSFYFKQSKALYLDWLIGTYEDRKEKSSFFIPFFTNLAGTQSLQKQIEAGMSADDIRASWKADIEAFKKFSAAYYLYD